MNIINKWILNRAEKIKADKEAREKSTEAARQKEYERQRQVNQKAKQILYESLQPFIDKMSEETCHIKPTDVAVINKYGMLHKDCFNGWDGGPNSFLRHCHEDDRNTPVMVDILSIHVDTSLAHERIENWVDNRSYEVLEKLIMNPGSLFAEYHTHATRMTPKDYTFGKTYGLYKTAMFKGHFTKFNPTWGLNVGSFLECNTPEAKETVEIWREEISLDFARKQLKEQTDKIDARKREIDEKYRNIKYA
jgi:hypothetical protein